MRRQRITAVHKPDRIALRHDRHVDTVVQNYS